MQILLTFLISVALVGTLLYLFWRARFGLPAPGSIPILAYHKVDSRLELGGTMISPRRFARHLEYFKKNSFQSVTLSQAVELMRQDVAAGKKYLCLTFDDAYQGFYRHAFPLLKEFGFTATVFAVTDFVGKSNDWDINWGGLKFEHLSWEQMKEMQVYGIEFGSHTKTHRDLRFLSPEQLRDELAASRKLMEQNLGVQVTTLSYPFGLYNEAVKQAALEAGYLSACSFSPRMKNSEIDFYALRRCGVYVTDIIWDLKHKIDHDSPWFWPQDLWSRLVNWCAGGTALAKRILHR
ncbi:polysaccharide deacetylase family protein [candidate division TA06 bacterium]|uniref:Polysaccharide deacetylase family protein n=1 Tax=candidate division TA06 bacterium TaxID=2250710 RepID=A0A933IA09_UNCT6|nr:polysaccharide deacetylase family protein [candidate division TA06 bacterium]